MSDRITLPLYAVGWSSEAPLLDHGAAHLLACKNYIIKQNLLESRKGYFNVPLYDTNDDVVTFNTPIKTIIPLEEYNMVIVCADKTIYVFEKIANKYTQVASQSGYSTDEWRWCYANHQIIMVNGQDNAQQVSVTDYGLVTQAVTIQDWAVTGAGSLIFDWIATLNAQICAGFGTDLNVWYLPVGYVQGTQSSFDIAASSGTPKKGGKIVAAFNISRDSGMNLNSYIGFLTSQGEAIIYSGNDLDDPTNIEFNGIYQTGFPLGKTPFINWSGDLIIMTSKGFISAHSIFANGENQSAQYIFSQRINTWVLDQAAKFGNLPGFMGLVVPNEDIVLFNVPQAGNTFVQAVMNITSGKWSMFTDINAYTMCVANGNLLFGMADGVYQYGLSESDPNFIPLECWSSYSACGSDFLKRINMIQLRHAATDKINIAYDVYKDFENQAYYNWVDTSEIPESIGETGFYWSNDPNPDDPTPGTAYWGTEYWAGGFGDLVPVSDTYSASGLGHNFSVRMRANVKGIQHQIVDLMLLFNASKTAI